MSIIGACWGEMGFKKYENTDFHNYKDKNYKVPDDYKVHIMSGSVSHIDVIVDRLNNQKEIAMDEKWVKMPFDYIKKTDKLPESPLGLKDMLEIARRLAQPLSYVRVDLYCIRTRIYVGEFTFTPAGGTDIFTPNEWDYILGKKWQISQP